MQLLLILSLLITFSCGKNNNKETISSPSVQERYQVNNQQNISNEFFQVSLKHFMFKTDGMKIFRDFDIEKSKKFKFYEMQASREFLNRQLSFATNEIDALSFSPHVELFHITKRKLTNSFPYLTAYQLQEPHLRTVRIDVKGAIDIDHETKKKVSGIDLLIWDHYKNEYFEIATMPISRFRKSLEYEFRYDFKIQKVIPFEVMDKMVKRDLKFLFRLDLKKEKEDIHLYINDGHKTGIQKFEDFYSFQSYLKNNLNKYKSLKENVIHNLDQANRNILFYFIVKTDKNMIENDFTFLQFEEEVLEPRLSLSLNDPKYHRYEFEGRIVKELWEIKEFNRRVHGHTKPPSFAVNTSCSMRFQKIGENIWVPINYEKVGAERAYWKNVDEVYYQSGVGKFYFQMMNGNQFNLKTLNRDYQEVVIGRSKKKPACGHVKSFNKIWFDQDFVYKRTKKQKKDIFKLTGVLKKYFIPWEVISWPESINYMMTVTE